MSFLENIRLAKAHLEEQGRISLRAIRSEFDRDDDELSDLDEELVQARLSLFSGGSSMRDTQGAG